MKKARNIIALFGGTASGKTSLAVEIALTLASENKRVIVLFPEDITPTIPCLCAESELNSRGTLGSIYIAPHISPSLISYQLTTIHKIPTLAFLGFEKGENRYSYPAPTLKQSEQIIQQCSAMSDYLIVDISSNFTRDLLSTTALLSADCILRVENLDIKNVSYLSSNLTLLTSHPKFKADRQIKLLNDKWNDSLEVLKQKKNYDVIIPYCEELSEQGKMGNLLSDLKDKTSVPFQKAVTKLIKQLT